MPRRPRELDVERGAELRLAPPVFAVLRLLLAPLDFAVDLRAVDEPLFALEPLLFAVERDLVPLLFEAAEDRLLALLRPALVVRRELLFELLRPLLPPLSSIGHLPDITRCAASLTASAINAPSLVALVITELAALLAVSAASIPASLIALRALGLALIAAAAAASPAASISLLIAALPSLSSVVSLFEPDDLDELDEPDFEDFDEPLRVLDLAIANLPIGRPNRHIRRTTVPLRWRKGAGFRRIKSAKRARNG